MQTTKALITGGHGFLGKHLQNALKERGIEPILINHETLNPHFSLYTENVRPDYVFHLATAGNRIDTAPDDAEIFISNLAGTFNLLQSITDIEIKGFINVSTSSVLLPYQTLYSATKAGAENLCKAISIKYNKPIISMRPFSLYGEGDHESHLISKIFRSCLYKEELYLAHEPVHDWLYVRDFVEQMINYATEASFHKGEVINVGTGTGTSNYWLLKEIEEITDHKANIVGRIEPREYDSDEWIARSNLGNVEFAKTSLHEGLLKVYEEYKQ